MRFDFHQFLVCSLITPVSISLIGSASACSTGDIKLKQADLVRQEPSGYLLVVGELVNECDEGVAVEFHLTVRDKAGKVVSSDDVWPTGDHNIPPHSSYSFTVDAEEPNPDHRGTSFQIDVIDVIDMQKLKSKLDLK